jgi:hypothetical protein
MIKTSKQQLLAMETKLFQKSKCYFLIFHQSSMFYNDIMDLHLPLGQRYSSTKTILCSIQIQMVIKHYVIHIIILNPKVFQRGSL